MQHRQYPIGPAAIAVAAVLGLAIIMFVTTGLTEALVLLAVVGVLSGMYRLRHYARAKLIYRRAPEPASRAPADEQHS